MEVAYIIIVIKTIYKIAATFEKNAWKPNPKLFY
jgi:hypothetical protein